MLVLAFAFSAMATHPEPMLHIELQWLGPETLAITVENEFDDIRFEGTMYVTAGIGPREVWKEPIVVAPGKTERTVRIPLIADIEQIGVRIVRDDGELLLVNSVHVTRDAQLTPEEAEQHHAAQRAVTFARANEERRERMRMHVQRVIARGGKPTCSDESAADWNEAVVEVMGDEAPAACRQRTSSR